ncbi:hypothetical protein MMF93_28100 [Streptomyces tubbatahanensis]|uniref:Oxidoreductase n=1 Tax=Streptomyces tubbatahanensis TaxID=2923272 RepID=A0ABY3XZI6_9ACTN|nr:hypothetical protein [Streptomyces tubbatahanensis]UNS99887.1 hypothetical protein MMF93_28100 [Streptomyces tubbatahanensis]
MVETGRAETSGGRERLHAALRYSGVGKLLRLYRYFAFDLPRLTSGAGALLLLGTAAARLHQAVTGHPADRPGYVAACLVVLASGAFLAAVGVVAGARRVLTRAGWVLGSLVSAVSAAGYLVGRVAGLPGLPELQGRWDYPLGTASLILAGGFLALHVSVLTGMNVAVPDTRHWHH